MSSLRTYFCLHSMYAFTPFDAAFQLNEYCRPNMNCSPPWFAHLAPYNVGFISVSDMCGEINSELCSVHNHSPKLDVFDASRLSWSMWTQVGPQLFFFFFSFDCYSGPIPPPPGSPAT